MLVNLVFLFVLLKMHSRSSIVQPKANYFIVCCLPCRCSSDQFCVCVCVCIIWLVVCICMYVFRVYDYFIHHLWGPCSAVIHWILEIVSCIHYFSEQCINSWNPLTVETPFCQCHWCFDVSVILERKWHLIVVLP